MNKIYLLYLMILLILMILDYNSSYYIKITSQIFSHQTLFRFQLNVMLFYNCVVSFVKEIPYHRKDGVTIYDKIYCDIYIP